MAVGQLGRSMETILHSHTPFLHSRITNTFSDIGRPRSSALALSGCNDRGPFPERHLNRGTHGRC
jgi:hypothetical protein